MGWDKSGFLFETMIDVLLFIFLALAILAGNVVSYFHGYHDAMKKALEIVNEALEEDEKRGTEQN